MCLCLLYLQFCDMVSTDTYSAWAGPIIDVLLDYVGDVKLCSRLIEHLDSYSGWANIKEKASTDKSSAFMALNLMSYSSAWSNVDRNVRNYDSRPSSQNNKHKIPQINQSI